MGQRVADSQLGLGWKGKVKTRTLGPDGARYPYRKTQIRDRLGELRVLHLPGYYKFGETVLAEERCGGLPVYLPRPSAHLNL